MTEIFELHGVRFVASSGGPVRVARIVDNLPIATISGTGDLERDALDWIAGRIGATPSEVVSCTACSAELEPVYANTSTQFRDALQLTFSGGYGMYVDTIGGDGKAIICGPCADELRELNPWLGTLLDTIG